MQFHPFHLVNQSPWPLVISFNLFNLMCSTIFYFYNFPIIMNFINLSFLVFTFFMWSRDVIRESSYQGHHTSFVVKGLKLGMMMFIVSEIFFFFSIFWAYFDYFLSPELFIGMNWPPLNIQIFNPFQIPLLNTIVLLSSGVTITWAHFNILNKNFYNFFLSTTLTILLGGYFSFLQFLEYQNAYFSINDSSFGSIFFLATGFHGLHVLIGTIFISMNLIRCINNEMNSNHHIGFEFSAWYWHFVDVVWLFLYTFIYWWIFN